MVNIMPVLCLMLTAMLSANFGIKLMCHLKYPRITIAHYKKIIVEIRITYAQDHGVTSMSLRCSGTTAISPIAKILHL